MTKYKAQSACQVFTIIIHETGFNFGGTEKNSVVDSHCSYCTIRYEYWTSKLQKTKLCVETKNCMYSCLFLLTFILLEIMTIHRLYFFWLQGAGSRCPDDRGRHCEIRATASGSFLPQCWSYKLLPNLTTGSQAGPTHVELSLGLFCLWGICLFHLDIIVLGTYLLIVISY